MSASTTATLSSSADTTSMFWERFWRLSGIQFVVLFIIANVIYGYQPQLGASADALVEFYDGHRTWVLVATVIAGLNLLNLMWFTAALRTTLADVGQDGWGAAATAASAAFAALFFLGTALNAALAYSIAGAQRQRAHVGAERPLVGPLCPDIISARDAHHVRSVRTLARAADLELTVHRRRRTCRSGRPGRYNVA